MRRVFFENDYEYYLDETNLYHRENGPAFIDMKYGTEYWYIHGEVHREDGPAIYNSHTDYKEWCYHGKRIPVSNLKDFQSYLRNKAFW
jgi:hypothetical protein